MRTNRIAISFTALIIVTLASKSHSQSSDEQAQQVTYVGTVVDAQERPIAGTEVTFYAMEYSRRAESYIVSKSGASTTAADGAFSFSASAETHIPGYRYGYIPRYGYGAIVVPRYGYGAIVARKEGMAFGFVRWDMREGNKKLKIELGQPKELAGIVVDENDRPVSGVKISISFLLIGTRRALGGPPVMDMFTSTTDAAGRFRFTSIPADATAEFVLKKAGCATVRTLRTSVSPGQKLKYAPGQSDIKLTLPTEARIEGTVVEGSSGKPVAGVEIVTRSIFGQKPVATDNNGKFSIGALTSETYVLRLAQPSEGPADWITQPLKVITEAGKIRSGIKVELHKGGLFEAVVTETVSKEPVEEARISIRRQGETKYISAISDENGIAGIRLMPGEYQIRNLRKDGYSSQSQDETVTVEGGKTTRIERQYTELPRIAGVVRDEKGNPVQGVKLQVRPTGMAQRIGSDAKGKFQVSWDPKRWYRSETPVMLLLGQYEQGNLAAAVEVNKDTRTQDIILRPALTVTGRVIGPDGKGIPNAQTKAELNNPRGRRWSSSMGGYQPIAADEDGRFEIRTLPMENSYTLKTRAEGYSEHLSRKINANDAVNNKLDIGDVTLAVADLSVSGVVVSGGRPVVGASVSSSPIYGNDQPRRKTQTGADGKFLLDGVCAGKIQVSGYKAGAPTLYGFVRTEGGATDIKIEIWALSPPANRVAKQPPSLVRKPLPELKDLKVGLSPANTAGKMMLVCFLDIEQRPSRNCLRQLNAKAQELKAKGVVVAAVQASKIDENSLDEWRKRYDISFPLGMVQGDQEKARFTWGVRSLPWLILTDGRHVVTAEGFGLSELDGKIEQTDGD